MARSPAASSEELQNRGAWTAEEDKLLVEYVNRHGKGKWRKLAEDTGLKRSGKSCRLRWLNYLRPELKKGNISPDEEDLILRLHKLLGNRWSLIAGRLPGRSDNEIKNYWNTTLRKKTTSTRSCLREESNSSDDNNLTVNHVNNSSLPSICSSDPKDNNNNNDTEPTDVDMSVINVFQTNNNNIATTFAEQYKNDDLHVKREDLTNCIGLEGVPFQKSGMVMNGCNGALSVDDENLLGKILMDLDGQDHVISDSEFWHAINDWIGQDS